ncbi:MAG TPA: pyroglutamyl-peptidase I [Thermoplasmatales archaeon]|nr:pyroglutamyl-peptidase I [Thermoplasmatales archaeon]
MRKHVIVTMFVLLLSVSAVNSVSAQWFNGNKPFSVTVLVTGFESFNGYDVNPAQLIAEYLDGQMIKNVSVVGISVPVEWNNSIYTVTEVVKDLKPAAVISIGLAPNARFIRIEKNRFKHQSHDNKPGKKWVIQKVDPDGPPLLLTDLPTYHIAKEVRNADIPARQSFFAGTYICNNLFYGLLKYKYEKDPDLKVGFIHVPPLTSMDPKKGMSFDEMVKAVKLVITIVFNEVNRIA